jgi:phosphopantothenoylcysteine decarboxylase
MPSKTFNASVLMANVLLGVTGSVAAIKTPQLFEELRRQGHAVKVVATHAALYFFDPAALAPLDRERHIRNPAVVIVDEDEWPGQESGQRYQRGDEVLHIELRRWADLLLIAPLDANTLAKLANGLNDNCLTCVWRAWDLARPIVLAPAMNTLMWEHPLTMRQLHQLAAIAGPEPPAGLSLDALVQWINSRCPQLRLVAPVSRTLACGDVGMGALASIEEIVGVVGALLA